MLVHLSVIEYSILCQETDDLYSLSGRDVFVEESAALQDIRTRHITNIYTLVSPEVVKKKTRVSLCYVFLVYESPTCPSFPPVFFILIYTPHISIP